MEETETPKPKRGRPPKARPVAPEHQSYMDPIAVELVMDGGRVESFRCVSYEATGPIWRFKSFPPERGRQTVRLVSASDVVSCRIDEPEKTDVPAPAPHSGTWIYPASTASPNFTVTNNASGPQSYVAKDHLANTARGGLVNGIPQSVARDENGNETVMGAAMLPPGAVS